MSARTLLNVALAAVSISACAVALTARDDAREARDRLRRLTEEDGDRAVRRNFEYQHTLQRLDRLEDRVFPSPAGGDSCP